MSYNPFKEQEAELEVMDYDLANHASIIVYNDDVNTFDWVITSFVEVLYHTSEQAEQLSMLIHFKGKANVKVGPKPELRPLKEALVDRGLSAVIEE